MASQEYLTRYIESKKYEELPQRVRQAITEEEWARKVRSHCIQRGFGWAGSPAAAVCAEHDYYEALLAHYRAKKRIFPYHLAEYVCRFLRVTPFRYYRDILADAMRDDLAYDAIPNFTAADGVKVVGVGRNEYIATMVQAKSKKLMWRMNKGIVKDLLPAEPKPLVPEAWWTVNLVNLTETEHRSLTRSELEVCQAAARRGGARYDSLNASNIDYLYRRGLIWFDVPVAPEDHLSIPPLEGFVSNKTSTSADDIDPLETLMYQIFVAASDRVTVAKLAAILNLGVDTLAVAISVACRLKFCRKLPETGESAQLAPPLSGLEGSSASLGEPDGAFAAVTADMADLDLALGPNAASDTVVGGGGSASALADTAASAPAFQDAGKGGGVALVVDAEVTGFLMMGALTPAVKKHSVTLFEGGRVYGAQVIEELVEELKASVEMAAGFEGEMMALAATAASLAEVLDCVKAGVGSRPIELLRKESLASLPPGAAFRILAHSYSVVIPVAGLPNPVLPLSLTEPSAPINYGPFPAATTPWLQLALYEACNRGPASVGFPLGLRLVRLPTQLASAESALVWPWDPAAVRAPPAAPLVVAAPSMLHSLNYLLSRTALLVQPLAGGIAAADSAIVSVALPLPPQHRAQGHTNCSPQPLSQPKQTNPFLSAEETAEEETVFEQPKVAPRTAGAPKLIGFFKDGATEEVTLPAGLPAALQALGLRGALGELRLMRDPLRGDWVPLSLALGMPLQPLALCAAVCARAVEAAFLSPESCRRHEEGQRTLIAALAALTARHGARGPDWGSPHRNLVPEVPLLATAVEVDGDGRARAVDLGGAGQGLSLVAF